MRFLSLFSGIEAASVAWTPLGWECVAVAEIDRFACDLLAKRYPEVPNLGDVTKITRAQIEALGHIDVVIAGFPCQDVSVAGKRAGLKGKDGKRTRSGLFHVARKLIRWSRARWAVLENVPGLFTSHDGRDFATVVGKMVGRQFSPPPGGWRNAGVAAGRLGMVEWATLDSQFFHVAQRRERVFLVRDAGAWADRPPVLLVPQSSLGNPPTRGEARTEVAGTPTPSAARRGPNADPHSGAQTLLSEPGVEVHPPLSAGDTSAGGGRRPGMSADDAAGLVAFVDLQNTKLGGDLAGTLDTSRPSRGGGAGVLEIPPTAFPDPAYALSAGAGGSKFGSGREKQDTFVTQEVAATLSHAGNPNSNAPGRRKEDDVNLVAHTLTAKGAEAGGGAGQGTPLVLVAYQCHGSNVDPMGALRAGNGNEAGGVPFVEADPVAFHTSQDPISGLQSPCLSQGNKQGCGTVGVLTQTRVRRLTPTECERLQGFPDGWTNVKRSLPNKKLRKNQLISPDGPRYRALGNSMTTTVIQWIGEQIERAAKGAP